MREARHEHGRASGLPPRSSCFPAAPLSIGGQPMKPQEQQSEPQKQERQQLDSALGRSVVSCLESTGDIQRVQVRLLWQNRYRVNVYVGADAASVRIASSYFLVTDEVGNIIESSPALVRQQ